MTGLFWPIVGVIILVGILRQALVGILKYARKQSSPTRARAPFLARGPVTSGRKRCAHLFVLGGGLEPGAEVAVLGQRFMGSNSDMDFSQTEYHSGSIGAWADASKIGIAVGTYVTVWFRSRGLQLNLDNIIYRDYYDDAAGKQYVVVAYLS